MKIERAEKFTPVTITLETQEEVDQMFCVVNSSSVQKALPALREMWRKLEPFEVNYVKYWGDFLKIIVS